ncbi:peptidase [Fannyhessea vaginae]|uniref:peptidase n=2 Tax=Fannyhessea vaginae TaxID=82135 RepID=UPI00288A3170|nr:peptidase [Fannyhessea vaginae]
MARKHHAKHSKNTILASSATKSFSKLSVGAASAVVGASLALSAAPALAQEMSPTDAQQAASTPLAQPANSTAAQNQQGRSTLSSKPSNQKTPNTPASALHTTQSAQKNTPTNTTTPTERAATSQQTDRAATPAPQPQVSDEVNLSADTKDTVPNMYAWGSSDNVFIENGQNHSVTFKFAKPTDGTKITKIAIFPADTNGVDNVKSRKFLEYYSDPNSANAHQSYSGKYAFTANDDGSATLTMTALYRDNNMDAEKYAANRCIYVYGNNKEGKEVLLYKTNIVRAATLVPPKTVGSIVLKYNEELTEQQIQDKLKAALDAPTAAKDGKSVRDQITAASKAFGVGGRTGENGKFVQTPDDPDKKVVITDKQAYDANQLATVINKVDASKTGTTTTYVTGVNNLKTYLVSDLGYKSEALPLTVARYDTRIDKPIVDDVDITKLTDDQKADICKKLAKLNHVTQDKVTFNDKGEVVINFDGVDAKDAPVIALKDLVIKRLKTDEYVVPTGDKATYVANPLGYSQAELARIKKSIYEANKDNTKLGLSATDYEKQITLSYITGDLTGAGDANKGRSNGLQENNISVTIKTDKALAEFTSDITKDKLTRLPDIRTDYKVELVKNKLDGRDSDEGFSWSDDKHTTLIYRYDPTKAQAFTAPDILKLIKATPKDQNTGLRPLTGGETLDHEGAAGKARKSHMGYAIDKNGEPTTELTLGMMNGAYWIGNPQVANSDVNLGNEKSIAGKYTWDNEAGSVIVAAKQNKVFKTRLFVAPYALTYYRGVYTNPYQRDPNNTPKAINVIFVPQTNHKKSDLKKSVEDHKTIKVEGKDVPTESTYYNASDAKKSAYDEALKQANKALELAGDTEDSKLAENLKALIDNATINLNKARAELDGDKTNKDGLNQSIDENGKAAEGHNPATGTQATNQFKNVSDPDFKKADGSDDTAKNDAAKKAKEDYDKALANAEKLKDDENATQEAVDNAKAQLDAARAKLNEFSTSKDKLNAALAEHGHVFTYTDDTLNTLTPEQKLANANPTYKNATPEEREAYDNALEEAMRLAKDPAASQKEVNEAIAKLEAAKQALDAKATNKSLLEAQLQTSRDHDGDAENQKSVFYKNGKDPNYFADTNTKFPQGVNKDEAKQYADKYDQALAKAKEILNNKDATQQQVNEALSQLKQAEENLHKLQSDASDLVKTLADNFTGYLLPAYFNAFNLSQSKDPALAQKAQQAAKDFKTYNDAYHAAKQLQERFKNTDPAQRPSQQEINDAKTMLEHARAVIDSYATDTSKLSVAILSDVAITASPAYKNAKALADKQNPAPEEQAQVEAAKKAVEAYTKAMAKIHQAFDNQMPKDQKDGHEIPADKAPAANGDTSSPNYLDGIQSHAHRQPLNKDVTDALADFNKAREGLNAFATKTDELIKSINKDSDTHPSPAFKNAAERVFQKADGSGADDEKNAQAKQAYDKYGEALNKAKEILAKVGATQEEVNKAKKDLDDARKELDKYKTDTTKLKDSVKEHGSTDGPGTTEGTVTSDAYRNASDPHFLTADGKPDETKNNAAKKTKADYDKALVEAQNLLKKADPESNTPLDAQPTQRQINDALTKLDAARKKLEDNYKTVTADLETEINKSTPEHAPAATEGDFEYTPEFKNATYKQGVKPDADPAVQQAKADVETYKNALKTARELLAKKDSATLSERPTQKQIDDALAALKQAKQAITNGYKTNTDKLTEAKDYANGDFKKTPEYKNADAIKGDNANAKHEQAAKDVDGTDDKPGLNKLIEKITQKLQNANNLTQREVDTLLKQLKSAQKKIADNYKTDVKPLANEVGDKDQDGNPIVPAFEESVTYKNALDKQNSGDADATAKLKDYNDKLDAAQKLLDKVAYPDPNAKPEDRPTNADVAQALEALKTAKKAIDDTFKTKAGALKLEADDKDEHGTAHNPAFEATTEYQNALGEKNPDGTDNADVQTYKKALEHAKKLLEKFDETGNPKAGAQDVPTQKDVDEALANLKDIKDKIKKNYVTNPHDLQEEVDKSKDGEDDTSEDAFENTPEFKNVSDRDDEAAKKALQDYTTALKNARELLDKFDRSTGKPKAGVSVVPTQKQLDDALKALQKAKQAILDGYKTDTSKLVADVDAAVDVDNKDYRNASREAQEAYDKALAAARAILKNPKATQAEIDAAQRALMLASDALMKSAHRPKLAPQQPARTNAPKHLAATSDATNTFAVMGMITSAFGLIFAGAKRKRQRRQ